MNGGGTGTLAWRWTRTQCMGCELGHWWACLVPVEHPDLARYVGVWSAWISPKVRALNQDLTRCDQLASQKLSLLHPLARTRPRNGHLKTNRTDLVYFCSPCMSSPRLSRTVRCRMQVGNQTHFFRSWWNKFEHKRSQTYTNTAYETHMCLQNLFCICCWESPLFPGTGLTGSMDIRSLTPSVQRSQRNGTWSFSDQIVEAALAQDCLMSFICPIFLSHLLSYPGPVFFSRHEYPTRQDT